MNKGTVKWFNSRRGYGFITDEDGVESFVHYSEIVAEGYRSLDEGAKVTYDVRTDDQGRSVACNVHIAD